MRPTSRTSLYKFITADTHFIDGDIRFFRRGIGAIGRDIGDTDVTNSFVSATIIELQTLEAL